MMNVLGLLSLWHIMGRRQLVWAEIIFMLFVGFFFLSEINACVPPRTQTQLHAMRGYCGSAPMCSSLIIRTLLCPIRRRDRQWKHSIDYLHFIIKPITTRKGEKEWNKDEIKLQMEEDKNSVFPPVFHSIFSLHFWALWLNVTKALKHIFGTKRYLCCCFDLVNVCVPVQVGNWKQSSCLAKKKFFLKLTFQFLWEPCQRVFDQPYCIFSGSGFLL